MAEDNTDNPLNAEGEHLDPPPIGGPSADDDPSASFQPLPQSDDDVAPEEQEPEVIEQAPPVDHDIDQQAPSIDMPGGPQLNFSNLASDLPKPPPRLTSKQALANRAKIHQARDDAKASDKDEKVRKKSRDFASIRQFISPQGKGLPPDMPKGRDDQPSETQPTTRQLPGPQGHEVPNAQAAVQQSNEASGSGDSTSQGLDLMAQILVAIQDLGTKLDELGGLG